MQEGFKERVLGRKANRAEETRQYDKQRIGAPIGRQSESERMKVKERREIRELRALVSSHRG